MKKMLLLLVCLTTFAWLHADEVTFNFMTNAYGVVNTDGAGTPGANNNTYFANPTTATSSPVSIKFAKTSGNGWRFYKDGVRFYKGSASLTISANGATITSIKLAGGSPSSAFNGGYTLNGGTSNEVAPGDLNIECNTTEAVLAFSKTTSGGNAAFKTITVTYTPAGSPTQVATPTFTPASGSAVVAGSTVTIACEEGANIYYTTDETEASTPYTEPIVVNKAMTIKAIAYMEGKTPSSVATATYTIMPSVANIAEFIELIKNNKDGLYSIQTPVTAVYQNGSNLYITDGKDWLLVYGNVEKKYENGDVIAKGIVGKPLNYSNGLYELSNPDPSTFAAGVAGSPVEPIIVTKISAEDVNKYVKVRNVNITGQGTYAQDANGNLFTIYDKFKIKPSDATGVNLIGFVGVSKGALQIYPTEITKGDEGFVATPTFTPVAGNVIEGTEVSIACATEGATIHYTTDGTDPSASSTKYTAPIAIDEAMTIKAIAVKEGMRDSGIAEAAYTLIVATPTFDPAAGAVAKGTEVTITCATEGATFRYQINEGEVQVGVSGMTITINEATTIKVVASKDGYVDSEATATYTIEGEAPIAPTAIFDFTIPENLQPAQTAPTFPKNNTSNPTLEQRALMNNKRFYNNYANLEMTTTQTNPQLIPQLWPAVWSADNSTIETTQLRVYAETTITITGAEDLMLEKIEFAGSGSASDAKLSNIQYSTGVKGTYSGTTGTWTRSAGNSRAATTGEREKVTFTVSGAARIDRITLSTSGTPTGVEDVTVDENAPVEYYNLQGVRVANPENGIYIRRQGSKVSKVLVR